MSVSNRIAAGILLAMLAVSAPGCAPAGEADHPATATIAPSSEPVAASPTTTVTPTNTATSEPTLTPEPTFRTPAECSPDCMLFYAEGDSIRHVDKAGIYLASVDGNFIEQVISAPELLDDGYEIMDIDASPDGRILVMAADNFTDPLSTHGKIYLWDLYGNQLVDVFTVQDYIGLITWSSDGAYLAFIAYDTVGSYPIGIITLHIETQTVSTLVDRELSINDLDWSHKATQLMYSTYETDGQINDVRLYLTNVNCDPKSHQCKIEEQTELGWIDHRNQSYRLALVPSDDAVVMNYAARLADGSINQFVESRYFDGELIRSIDLNEIVPEFKYYTASPPRVSYTANRVAFIGRQGDMLDTVYILDFDTGLLKTPFDLQHMSALRVTWIP